MSLKGVAQETVRISDEGEYRAPSGARVSIAADAARARAGTRLYRPTDVVAPARGDGPPPRIEVWPEKTGAAARRLFAEEGIDDVALLNFASAKNPGGGFLGGAKAQEEDLSRCSTLYRCLLEAPEYYAANRAHGSLLYTDHVIYSPRVPFFRDESLELLERPFVASVITAPAPNAGEELRRDPGARPAIAATLRSRALRVLEIAVLHGHRTLVLGAWGCGVFRNDPAECAEAFARGLEAMQGCFDRVVFAVYDRSGEGPNLRAFRGRFAP